MQLSFGFFHHEQPSSPLGSIIQRKHSLTFPKCPTVAEQRQQGHHDCQYFDIQNLYLHRVVPFTSTYAIIMWALLSQRESQLAYGMELSLFLPQGLRSSYSKRIQGRPSSVPYPSRTCGITWHNCSWMYLVPVQHPRYFVPEVAI